MRIEISNLDRQTFNRARYQLDSAAIQYYEQDDTLLACESDDPAALRNFVNVALYDPNARVYR